MHTDNATGHPSKQFIIHTGQGKTLRDIEEKSGCQIKLPSDRTSSRKETTVTIIGKAAARSVAKAVIKDFVELGFSPKLKPGMKMHSVSVSVRCASECMHMCMCMCMCMCMHSGSCESS